MIMMGDRKRTVAAILGPQEEKAKEEGGGELRAIAEELIDAVHAKDSDGVIAALRATFSAMDAEPHVEGLHLED